MDRLNIGQEAKVLIKWRVLPIDRTDEAEENIAAKFAKKYGIIYTLNLVCGFGISIRRYYGERQSFYNGRRPLSVWYGYSL